jgi:hypothetical protein
MPLASVLQTEEPSSQNAKSESGAAARRARGGILLRFFFKIH